jgi:hypothetical protein
METKLLCASSYGLLSLYRSRLMGLACCSMPMS